MTLPPRARTEMATDPCVTFPKSKVGEGGDPPNAGAGGAF